MCPARNAVRSSNRAGFTLSEVEGFTLSEVEGFTLSEVEGFAAAAEEDKQRKLFLAAHK